MRLNNSFLLLIIVLLLSSCKTIDMVLYPDDYIKRNGPIVKEFIYDTVRITNIDGNISEPLAGYRPKEQLIFNKLGQYYQFKPNETIEIVSDGIDFARYTFDIETDEETKSIKITLVDRINSSVKLVSKCQTITRTGIDYVPKIELGPNLSHKSHEQIVVTPMFDKDCNKIGYQIRYGSTERGCGKVAEEVLKRFKRCADGPTTTPPPEGTGGLKKKLGLP